MVAFATPRAALEWCLVVQEAALYLKWPESVLLHRGFASVHSANGDLVFRGPRLKMGLCVGPPKAIMPDALGRADYHGNSVNQAARYMDAGAHGGQVRWADCSAAAPGSSSQSRGPGSDESGVGFGGLGARASVCYLVRGAQYNGQGECTSTRLSGESPEPG
jgi:hypothetical protein